MRAGQRSGVFSWSGTAIAAAFMILPFNRAHAYTEKTLYTFCSQTNCADGNEPNGNLVMDSAGNLYGTTSAGGANSDGVVFEVAAGTGQYRVLYNFCSVTNCADGAMPYRVQLIVDTSGNLYGTTEYGGNAQNAGVVFELVRKGKKWKERVLYAFCPKAKSCPGGARPYDGMTYAGAAQGQPYDGQSPLYGTTNFGGAGADGGALFSLAPGSGKKWQETVLYSFCSLSNCTDGEYPDTPLYLDTSGNIYGTTPFGGEADDGTVFELSPNHSTYIETVLYSLCGETECTDGKRPFGGVVMDSSGNLYGTASDGGDSAGDGLIFTLASGTQYSVVAEFDRANGSEPLAMLLDANGNLIGTTYAGGAHGKGTVFEYAGSSITDVYGFCAKKKCSDGEQPVAGAIQDGAGNLYGVATSGENGGTIYELSP